MEFTVAQVAGLLNGTFTGDGTRVLRSVARIEDADEGDLAFLSNPTKYAAFAYASKATALLVPSDFEPEQALAPVAIKVADVQKAISTLLGFYQSQLPQPAAGIDTLAFVHPTAKVDPAAHVAPFAYVGQGAVVGANTILEPHSFVGAEVQIGESCLLQSGARVLQGCVLGNRVRLLANAVVGSDGFGHTREEDGAWIRIAHIGNVVIEDDVEIGACTTVDRAVMGSTILRRGVKLDNLVMVAHNVEVGEHTAAAAQVGMAGSARLGKRIMLGGQVGMAGHITLADDVEVGAQSGIKDSVTTAGAKLFGSPAKPFRVWAGEQASLRRVGKLQDQVRALQRQLDALSKQLSPAEEA